jgi:hypothetical protein
MRELEMLILIADALAALKHEGCQSQQSIQDGLSL